MFGLSVAAGDFNGDGYSDLAIGVPNENVTGAVGAGAVNVIYGNTTGLESTGNQLWSQNSGSILDTAEASDNFGFVLVAGDFNKNGKDDLAIGVPLEDIATSTTNISNAGAVNVIYGSSTRLTSSGNQFWSQNSSNILDFSENGDHMGSALAAGMDSANQLT